MGFHKNRNWSNESVTKIRFIYIRFVEPLRVAHTMKYNARLNFTLKKDDLHNSVEALICVMHLPVMHMHINFLNSSIRITMVNVKVFFFKGVVNSPTYYIFFVNSRFFNGQLSILKKKPLVLTFLLLQKIEPRLDF